MAEPNGKYPTEPPELKELDEAALKRTVTKEPSSEWYGPGNILTMALATVADDIAAWGSVPFLRDQKLREFWPTENVLAGAIYGMATRNAAFSWRLDGPPRTVQAVQDILHAANLGKGWLDFVVKVTIDLLTQDNGAFIEIIRERDSEGAAVVGINHLDAARCRRTGVAETPVIYQDRMGDYHKLQWYQVIALAEMPSPIETMNGMQYSGLTRILRAAQIIRDLGIYKREKIGARGPASIHLISGVAQARLDDADTRNQEKGDNQGLMRYLFPTIIASLDPTAGVSHVEIPIKSLPEGFNEDITMRWYIVELALSFGADYQDFAPLPGGGIGSSNQSEILHRKSRGKGPAYFMKMLEHAFNFHGVMPRTVTFEFDEVDTAADMEQAELKLKRADWYDKNIKNGNINNEVARQMMVDEGDLSEEMLALLGNEDVTDDVTATDTERYEEPEVDATPQAPLPDTQTPTPPPNNVTTPTEGVVAKFFRWLKSLGRGEEKSIAGYVRDYEAEITGLAIEVFNRNQTRAQFAAALRSLIRSEGPGVYEEGMREGGSNDPAGDMDEGDDAILAGWIDDQLEFVNDFADAVGDVAGLKPPEATAKQQSIFDRAKLWAQSLATLGGLAKARALGDPMLTFDGDDGEESCDDCQRYKGQRHRRSWWEKNGLLQRNGNENFKCGRWGPCKHHYYDDDGNLVIE